MEEDRGQRRSCDVDSGLQLCIQPSQLQHGDDGPYDWRWAKQASK